MEKWDVVNLQWAFEFSRFYCYLISITANLINTTDKKKNKKYFGLPCGTLLNLLFKKKKRFEKGKLAAVENKVSERYWYG